MVAYGYTHNVLQFSVSRKLSSVHGSIKDVIITYLKLLVASK